MATNINYTSTNDVRIYTINTANLNGNSNAFQYTFFLTLNSISVDRLVENYSYILKIDNKRSYTWTGAGTNITYKIFANTGTSGSTSATYQRNSVSLPSFSNTSGNLFTLFSGSVTLTKQLPTDYSWFTIVLTNTTSGLAGTPAPMNYSYRAITSEVPLPLKLYPETSIQNIATMIRRGNGTNNTYTLSQMPAAISALSNIGGDESIFISMLSGTRTILKSYSTGSYSRIKPYFLYSYSTSDGPSILNFPNVLEVGDAAFYDVRRLTSINFPVCKRVGEFGFYNCLSLSNINIPLVEYLGSYAFYNTMISLASFSKCTYLGKLAFGGCTKLSSANLPVCEVVETGVFNNCNSLAYLSIPKLKIIGSGAFSSLTAPFLSSIIFSASQCTIIGDYAFCSCVTLSGANFINCSSIGSHAFRNCYSLKFINIPSCEYLGSYAFSSCSLLSTINLSACKIIGRSAFANCYSLSRVDLGALTELSYSTFVSCYHLLSVYIRTSFQISLPNNGVFYSTPISTYTTSTGGVRGKIYVPASLVETYKSATNWAAYSSVIYSI